MEDDITLTDSAPVRRVVLNRPNKLNALTQAMWQAIPALVADVDTDQNCRVLVIEGAGDRAFAAGQDIGEFEGLMSDPSAAQVFADAVYEAQQALARCTKPVIAKIKGPCIGGGCGIALCADIRVAAEDAKLGITPAKLGIRYGLADTKRLVDAVGASRAKDLLFTGRIVGAEEARSIGLVDRVVEAPRLNDAVEELAQGIASNAPTSLLHIKSNVTAILAGVTDDTPETRQAFVDAFASPDLKEGVAAFKAKRAPNFPGD